MVNKERRFLVENLNAVKSSNEVISINTRFFYSFLASLTLLKFVIVGRVSIRRVMNYYLRLAILATSFEMSIINNAGTVSRLIFSPLLGYLSHKKGRELFIELGSILAILVLILYISFNDLIILVTVSIINVLVMAVINTVGYAYVADIVPERTRGKYFGQYNLVRTISSGFIPIL